MKWHGQRVVTSQGKKDPGFCVTAVQQEFSLGLNFISSSIIFLYVLILNLCTVEWEEN